MRRQCLPGLAIARRLGRPVSTVGPFLRRCGLGRLGALEPKPPTIRCVAWRARDLCGLVEHRFGVRYGESGMLKLLKGLDLSWRKARPVHLEADPKAQERFNKLCPA